MFLVQKLFLSYGGAQCNKYLSLGVHLINASIASKERIT